MLGATLAIDVESELEHKESLWLKALQGQDARRVSFREADSMQQLLETRITAQRVESGIHPEKRYSIGTGAICSLQPEVCLFFVS